MKLLELALKVRSGLERWRELQSLDVQVSLTSSIRVARKRGYSNEQMTTRKHNGLWCFSPRPTAATSRERNCLSMAVSHKYRPRTNH